MTLSDSPPHPPLRSVRIKGVALRHDIAFPCRDQRADQERIEPSEVMLLSLDTDFLLVAWGPPTQKTNPGVWRIPGSAGWLAKVRKLHNQRAQ